MDNFFQLSLGQLGGGSVLLATGVIIYAIVAGVLGALRQDARLQTSARFAAVAAFLAMTTAILTMEAALLTDDFSVKYVAEHSSSLSPLWVKIVTLWAALEGSVLLWAWLLTAYTAVLAMTAPNNALRPWALVTMQVVQLFFVGVVATIANPFIVLANPPLDGPGPNPLLQNHWMMAVHPFLMYLGFVGLTVPFAFAMSALITKRPGSEWMTQTRVWTLAGWGFLSAAIIAGGWWSYEILGWGGYWAWDPVENVSLLPWLTATAFIHSVQVQERRRMLKAWNILLITLTFGLSILGTFLTRSGVVSSVHAFGDGPVGPAFFGFFILVVLVSFGLLALRWDQVQDRAELDSPVSREGSFLLGNVFFLAMAFTVLLGTLFPLIVEATTGNKVTVGAPFFDQVSIPIWLAVFALMGIGPLLPWRKADNQSLLVNLAWLVGGGVLTGLAAYLLGVHKLYPLLTVALAGYNLVSIGLLLSGAIRPRVRATNRSAASVFGRYAVENRRRFGSIITHFAVVVIALGVAGSGGYRVDEQVRINIGESASIGRYDLFAQDIFMERTPGRISSGGIVEIRRNGEVLATMRPKNSAFAGSPDRLIPTPAVFYTPMRDVFLNVSTVRPGQDHLILRVVQSPLVTWIWIGGFILAFGTVYSLVPQPQRKPRTESRTVTA